MQEKKQNSATKQVLAEIFTRTKSGELNEATIYQMHREIEEEMKLFDLEKRRKSAQSAEDLSKLVITA
jgi:hypothetical protein